MGRLVNNGANLHAREDAAVPTSRSQVPGTSGAPSYTPSSTPGGVNSGAGIGPAHAGINVRRSMRDVVGLFSRAAVGFPFGARLKSKWPELY